MGNLHKAEGNRHTLVLHLHPDSDYTVGVGNVKTQNALKRRGGKKAGEMEQSSLLAHLPGVTALLPVDSCPCLAVLESGSEDC